MTSWDSPDPPLDSIHNFYFVSHWNKVDTMSTTKIPVSGDKSPEYKALRSVYEKLTTLINLDPGRVAVRLFGCEFLSTPPKSHIVDSSTLMPSIMNHIEHKAIEFYKFLGILNTLGTDADAELTAIHAKFVGKYICLASHYQIQ